MTSTTPRMVGVQCALPEIITVTMAVESTSCSVFGFHGHPKGLSECCSHRLEAMAITVDAIWL